MSNTPAQTTRRNRSIRVGYILAIVTIGVATILLGLLISTGTAKAFALDPATEFTTQPVITRTAPGVGLTYNIRVKNGTVTAPTKPAWLNFTQLAPSAQTLAGTRYFDSSYDLIHHAGVMAIDASNNVYMVWNENDDGYTTPSHQIRKGSPDGTWVNFAGQPYQYSSNTGAGFSGDGGLATSARFNNVQGIAVDAVGNVYISDFNNNRIRKVDTSGIITTIAGDGVAEFSGDGGLASLAQINGPRGLEVDSSGNLYFIDSGNFRLRKIDTSGNISTLAGIGTNVDSGDGGAATSASLLNPRDVTVDFIGNIYIGGTSDIRKIDSAGDISEFAAIEGTFISADASGDIYSTYTVFIPAAEYYYDDERYTSIRRTTPAGATSVYMNDVADGSVWGMAMNAHGDVYVAGDGNNPDAYSPHSEALKIDKNYRLSGTPVLGDVGIYDVELVATGLISTVTQTFQVQVEQVPVFETVPPTPLLLQGDSYSYTVGLTRTVDLNVIQPSWLTVSGTLVSGTPGPDDAGTNYVTLSAESPYGTTLQKYTLMVAPDMEQAFSQYIVANEPYTFTTDVDYVSVISVTETPAWITASTVSPTVDFVANIGGADSVAFDSEGNRYLSTKPIRRIGIDGTVTTMAGSYSNPVGVAVDSNDLLYVADTNRVWTVDLLGNITLFAGGGGSTADGVTATSAQFTTLGGITIDANDNVYIADHGQDLVRKVTAADGLINTVAGTLAGYDGDGGQATAAKLTNPYGLAVDAAGNLYIADQGNQRIRMVDTSGVITTFAGTGVAGFNGDGGLATAAQLHDPTDVTVDADGNVYIADRENHRVRVVDTSGNIDTFAGDGTTGNVVDGAAPLAARFSTASGVGIDNFGRFYAVTHGSALQMITPAGVQLTGTPSAIDIGQVHTVTFVAENSYQTITQTITVEVGLRPGFESVEPTITPAGQAFSYTPQLTRTLSLTATQLPSWLSFDGATLSGTPTLDDLGNANITLLAENNFGTTENAFSVKVFEPPSADVPTTTVTTSVGVAYSRDIALTAADSITISGPSWLQVMPPGIPTIRSQFHAGNDSSSSSYGSNYTVSGAATDAAGNAYFATWVYDYYDYDYLNSYVYKVAPDGTQTRIAGSPGDAGASGDGGLATSAKLYQPYALAVDSAGNVYIADYGYSRIRRVDAATGIITLIASSTRANGLAIDSADNLYFSQETSHIVRRRDAGTGAITTVAGTGGAGFSGDGGAASSAQLNHPNGLAFDAADNLYIADTYNNSIRKVAPDGTITTVAGNGSGSATGDGGAATSAGLNRPIGVSVDLAGNIYVGDTNNHRVRKIDTSGVITTIAGNGSAGFSGDGGIATSAQLSSPGRIAASPDGRVYFVDAGYNRLRVLDPAPFTLDGTPTRADMGLQQFDFVVGNALGVTSTATMTVNVVNDAPTTTADTYSVAEDTTLTVAANGVLGNDNDVNSDVLTTTVVTGPASGALDLAADGSFIYTPTVNYNGIVTFTYIVTDGLALSGVAPVTITINAVNDEPVGVSESFTTTEDTQLVITATSVLSNDTDVENSPLTASLSTDVASGALTLTSSGTFTYTPAANANGAVTFQYRAYDGAAFSEPITVTLNVVAVNDAPIVVDDAFSLVEDIVFTNTVLTNDSEVDGDVVSAEIVTTTPGLNLAANGTFTYTPPLNSNGIVSFTYRLSDSLLYSNIGTVVLTVQAVNDAPEATGDSYSTEEDTYLVVSDPGTSARAVSFGDIATQFGKEAAALAAERATQNNSRAIVANVGLLANDSDTEGSTLSAALTGYPSNGFVTLNPNGTFFYAPAIGFTGVDTFTYATSDGILSDEATVTITVTASTPPVPPLLFTAGWNLFGFTWASSDTVTNALQPIDGSYNIVWGYDDATDVWQVHDVARVGTPFESQNSLINLSYGEGYWIHITQPVTVTGSTNGTARATVNPPMQVYGTAFAAGVTIQAQANGSICASTTAVEQNGTTMYALTLPDTCSGQITLLLNGASAATTTWDNTQSKQIDLVTAPTAVTMQGQSARGLNVMIAPLSALFLGILLASLSIGIARRQS